MARAKDHPKEFKRLRDAQKILMRAVEGGLLADLHGQTSKRSWTCDGGEAREVCRRLRALLPDGARLVWKEGEWPHDAHVSVELDDGRRLVTRVSPITGVARYEEG